MGVAYFYVQLEVLEGCLHLPKNAEILGVDLHMDVGGPIRTKQKLRIVVASPDLPHLPASGEVLREVVPQFTTRDDGKVVLKDWGTATTPRMPFRKVSLRGL